MKTYSLPKCSTAEMDSCLEIIYLTGHFRFALLCDGGFEILPTMSKIQNKEGFVLIASESPDGSCFSLGCYWDGLTPGWYHNKSIPEKTNKWIFGETLRAEDVAEFGALAVAGRILRRLEIKKREHRRFIKTLGPRFCAEWPAPR